MKTYGSVCQIGMVYMKSTLLSILVITIDQSFLFIITPMVVNFLLMISLPVLPLGPNILFHHSISIANILNNFLFIYYSICLCMYRILYIFHPREANKILLFPSLAQKSFQKLINHLPLLLSTSEWVLHWQDVTLKILYHTLSTLFQMISEEFLLLTALSH